MKSLLVLLVLAMATPAAAQCYDRFGNVGPCSPSVDPRPTVTDQYGQVYPRDPGSGVVVNPQDGRVYAPAGPHGYVDTRTGQYVPVN